LQNATQNKIALNYANNFFGTAMGENNQANEYYRLDVSESCGSY